MRHRSLRMAGAALAGVLVATLAVTPAHAEEPVPAANVKLTVRDRPQPAGTGHQQYRALAGDQARVDAQRGAGGGRVSVLQARPGYDDVTFEQCDDNDASDTATGWIKNRFSFCHRAVTEVEAIEVPTGRRIGDVELRTTVIGYGEDGSRRLKYEFRVDEIDVDVAVSDPIDMLRDLVLLNGMNLTLRMTCTSPQSTAQHCRAPGGDSVTRTVAQWRLQGSAEFEFLSDNVGEGDDRVAFSLFRRTWTGQLPTGPPSPPATHALEYIVRWDSAAYLRGDGGSIFFRVDPHLTYRTNDDRVAEVAWHIWNAFYNPERTYPRWSGKSVPGNYDAVARQSLNRTRSTVVNNANRNAARSVCQGIDPAYSSKGLECDEFPFASTLQGGAVQSDPARRRFSACPIDGRQNGLAGNDLQNWYRNDRILDLQDFFYVRIEGEPPAHARDGCWRYP